MTKQTLYSLRTDGDQWRITKIVDGEIESSYLCTEYECECPAGVRPSCRHRQMLPELLARQLSDSMWFWDFDHRRAVDFEGNLKSNFDAMNELANKAIGATIEDFEREHGITKPLEGEILPPLKPRTSTPLPSVSWRRM
jgi:hypothetical protein